MSLRMIELPKEGILLYESKHVEGDTVTKHYHHIHQILYALEGEGEISLDGQTYAFNQDSVAVIVPKTPHSVKSGSKLTVLVLAFDPNRFDEEMRSELLQRFFHQSLFAGPRSFNGNGFRQLLRKALFEQARNHMLRALSLRTTLAELLILLARSLASQTTSDANSLRAERIRQYIDMHYFEIATAGDISVKHGMSSRYLNAIFKEQFQMTPMQYLTDIRVEMAKKMLLETNKEIAAICFELGFETVSTFYRIFKASTAMPPSKFRLFYSGKN